MFGGDFSNLSSGIKSINNYSVGLLTDALIPAGGCDAVEQPTLEASIGTVNPNVTHEPPAASGYARKAIGNNISGVAGNGDFKDSAAGIVVNWDEIEFPTCINNDWPDVNYIGLFVDEGGHPDDGELIAYVPVASAPLQVLVGTKVSIPAETLQLRHS